MVLDDTNIIDNQVSDPDINSIKTCLTLLPHRNNTNKFHLENVDCSSVQASVICRVDPLPTTTTTTTTTTTEPSSSSTTEVWRKTLPTLPCITPLRRRKRQPNANEKPSNLSPGKFYKGSYFFSFKSLGPLIIRVIYLVIFLFPRRL